MLLLNFIEGGRDRMMYGGRKAFSRVLRNQVRMYVEEVISVIMKDEMWKG